MSKKYILNHFDDIKKYENIIENRLTCDVTIDSLLEDNEKIFALANEHKVNYVLIYDKYEINIEI